VSQRRAARVGWSLCGLAAALVVISLVFSVLNRHVPNQGEFGSAFDAVSAIALLAFPIVGALIVSRHPRNSIGWLFCVVGIPFGLSGVAYGWGAYGLFAEPGALPGAEWGAWLGSWLFAPSLFAIPPLMFLLFPDGRAPTRRWRFVGWLVLAGVCATIFGSALAPGRLTEAPFKGIDNPAGIDAAGTATEAVGAAGFTALFFAILLGAAALVVRFRRSSGDERQQLKWFASAGALFAVAVVVAASPWFGSSDSVGQLLVLTTFAGIPIAAGVAILKHRLYDIDLVIRRTLVYAGLTALLAGSYLAGVLLLQIALSPLTADSSLAIAGSTLAVAALFRPARARIQAAVDRRFFRRRYDAARTLEGFGTRLREEVDLEALARELRRAAAETMQPAHVSLWLRAP
jgi:hypothetical protein